MPVTDIFQLNKIKAEFEKTIQERDSLREFSNKCINEITDLTKERDSLKDLLADIEKIKYLDLKQSVAELNNQKEIANQELIKINQQVEELKEKVVILNDEILYQSIGFYERQYNLQNSEQYKLRLDDITAKQKWLIKTEKAVSFRITSVTRDDFVKEEKAVQDFIKLILRSFNSECDANISTVKYNNIKAIEKKIHNDFDALNKLGRGMGISISKEYLKLKLDELYLSYEYQAKKQDEKEEQRRIREQMREEAKLLQEIEEMKDKIEKEQSHFNLALEKIKRRLLHTSIKAERELLEKEKVGVTNKLIELDKDLQDVQNREQNTRAGYVYIISNIGSFGENVYKIGVTRRLDPTERVDELGGASVPFRFDIHALIFSEDAPSLENALHKAFEDKRINSVNRRREFFRISLEEIEEEVKNRFNKPVEFMKTPYAAEFRETLALKNQHGK